MVILQHYMEIKCTSRQYHGYISIITNVCEIATFGIVEIISNSKMAISKIDCY